VFSRGPELPTSTSDIAGSDLFWFSLQDVEGRESASAVHVITATSTIAVLPTSTPAALQDMLSNVTVGNNCNMLSLVIFSSNQNPILSCLFCSCMESTTVKIIIA
jgi:hypothetical protein